MRLITFVPPGGPAGSPGPRPLAGWIDGDRAVWAAGVDPALGEGMEPLLRLSAAERAALRRAAAVPGASAAAVFPLDQVRLLAPLPRPLSIRDFYAFEAHVKNARARRGLPVPAEWYEAPVFYFSNTLAVLGPGDAVRRPRDTSELDFELEVAAVIGREGRDIPAAEAGSYIAGYMIMNDWSARDIQRAEMKVGLGPAKGKDFATSFGPWLATPDELPAGLGLIMTARVNGREVSRGRLSDMHFSFGQLIERASRDCTLYPGEVIGSGTVGTGCLLETGAAPWLSPGDVVELEVEGLGVLTNTVR